MADLAILVISLALFLVVGVSGRLSRVWLTEPLAMVVLGMVGAAAGLGPIALDHPASLLVLELTLALVLFTDAARIDLTRRGRRVSWPARMLFIGLPLTIILGSLSASLLFNVPLGVALLIGVILAPTDAALAQPVLETEKLPVRVRQSLNAEAGLNDGLALPGLFIALGIIKAEEGTGVGEAVLLVVEQIGIGVLGGIVSGIVGAWLIGRATSHGWMNPLHQKIAALALALATFAAVQLLGGSGFVATFVAGAVLAARVRPQCEYLYEFAEAEGKVLVLISFLFIGAGPVYLLVSNGAPVEVWVLAVLSLFVIRPVSIAISLVGGRLLPVTMAFLGWFGPRGLATVVFFLVASEELGMVDIRDLNLVIATVALSILLHGLTAKPASDRLARRLAEKEWAEMPEMTDVPLDPTRGFSAQTLR